MFASEPYLKMQLKNLSPPLKIGGPKPPNSDVFRRLRYLTATLTAYIFGAKHDIENIEGRWKILGVPYTVPKSHELWSTDGLK